jgi:hypothetical protein
MGIAKGIVLALVALAPLAAFAQSSPAADEPYRLAVKVGKKVGICRTGTIVCPAGNPMCDDVTVAIPEVTSRGIAFKGLKRGSTLCSAAASGGVGPRRVYRVVVE